MHKISLVNLLELILKKKPLTTSQLSILLDIKVKKLWYELSLLNRWLQVLGYPSIEIINGVIEVPIEIEDSQDIILGAITKQTHMDAYLRKDLMLLFLITYKDWISIQHFQTLLDLSKNSILNELKEVKEYIKPLGLVITYDRRSGYTLQGNEKDIRYIIELSILNILSSLDAENTFSKLYVYGEFDISITEIQRIIDPLALEYDISFVRDRYHEILYLLWILKVSNRNNFIIYANKTIEYIESKPLFIFAKEVCTHLKLPDSEFVFIATRLYSAIQGSNEQNEHINLKGITEDIVDKINVLTLGSLKDINKKEIVSTLYEHIIPTYYRLRFNIPVSGRFTQEIKKDYSELFDLVSKSLSPLEMYANRSIPEDEVTFFTIHFGGYLRRIEKNIERYKAVIVCPNGISSSLLLNSQLRLLFPNIDFLGIHSLEEFKSFETSKYDMVFSTIPVQSTKPVFVTTAIMNKIEEELLRHQVYTHFSVQYHNSHYDINKIIKIIAKHSDIKNIQNLEKDLMSHFYRRTQEMEGLNLDELLKEEFIQFTNKKMTWEQAIEMASTPLLDEGYIEPRYVNAMIEKVKEIGPYIVLAPKVAIPHAHYENGSHKLGVSLLVSQEPIIFDFSDSTKSVNLVFVLSAVDNSSHLRALQQLSYLLEEDENINAMIDIKDSKTLYEFIVENSREE